VLDLWGDGFSSTGDGVETGFPSARAWVQSTLRLAELRVISRPLLPSKDPPDPRLARVEPEVFRHVDEVSR